MGNLKAYHDVEATLSAKPIFKGVGSSVIALQLGSTGLLDKHMTKVPALLICVEGEVVFHDERGKEVVLKRTDFIEIEPDVMHWVRGVQQSQLVLIK